MKLKTKIALAFSLVVAMGALSVQRETITLRSELKKQGLSVAKIFADASRDALITDSFVHVMDFVETISKQEHVEYVLIADNIGSGKNAKRPSSYLLSLQKYPR